MLFGKNKKNEIEDEDFDLDDFDLDDDFPEFDDDDMDGDRDPSTKKVAKVAAKSMAKTAASQVKNDAIKELIPGDFNANFAELKDIASSTKDMIKESAGEITDSLSRVLPKSLADKLGIGRRDDLYQQISEQEQRAGEIEGALGSIFDRQSSHEEKIAAAEKDAKDTRIELTKLADSRMQVGLNTNMANDISKLTGFFLNIGSSYFRKSLELQYKSYFLLVDANKASTNYYKASLSQRDSIIKNTGLPEHVKITQGERLEGLVRNRLADDMYARLYTNNEFVQNIKRNIENRIRDTADMIRDGIDSVGMSFEMASDTGVSAKEAGAQIGGGFLGGLLGSRISKRLMPRLRERLGENNTLQNLGYGLENVVQNTATSSDYFKEVIARNMEAAEDVDGIKGKISRGAWGALSGLMGLTDVGSRNTEFKTTSMKDLNSPAIFDNNVYRSVTDSIPLYLSHILARTTDLKRMYQRVNGLEDFKDTPLQIYNYVSRKLGSMEDLRMSINSDMFKDKVSTLSTGVLGVVARAKDGLKGSKKHTKAFLNVNRKKSKKILEEYVDKVGVKDGVNGDYDTLFTNALKEDANPDVRAYLEENPELKSLIKDINTGMEEQDKGEVEGMKSNFNRLGKDSNNNYPIGSIITCFDIISELARQGDAKNTPNEDQALIFAKAWSAYVLSGERKNLIPETERVLQMYAHIPKDDLTKIRKVAELFLIDIDTIQNSDSKLMKQRALLAFGIVNQAIKAKGDHISSGHDEYKNMFDMLNIYNPEIFAGQTHMSVDQMVGGGLNLNPEKETTYSTLEDLRKMLNYDSDDVKAKVDALSNSKLFKGIEDLGNQFGEVINEQVGFFDKSMAVFDLIAEKTKEKLNAQYDRLGRGLDKLGNSAEKMTIAGINKSINSIAKYVRETSDDLKALRKEEEKDYHESVRSINELISNIRKDEPDGAETLYLELEEIKERREKRIAGYELLDETLTSLSKELLDLNGDSGAGEKSMDKAKQLYEVILTKVSEMKNIMDVFKRENI